LGHEKKWRLRFVDTVVFAATAPILFPDGML